MSIVWGRECKLGWGYNQYLHQLIPAQKKLSSIKSKTENEWGYIAWSLSSTEIPCLGSINLFLEQSFKQFLDFLIVSDDTQYWLIHCQFIRRVDKSKKFSKYPPNCSDFINQIYYGVEFWVQLPKIEFSEDKLMIQKLFKQRIFSEAQEMVRCKVLINHNEIREMTLGELLVVMKEVEKEKYFQYDVPVGFGYKKLAQEIQKVVVSDENEFLYFLLYLYCAYRKIETNMKENGYLSIIPDTTYEEKSFTDIYDTLFKAKSDYKSTNKQNVRKVLQVLKLAKLKKRTDFSEMYLVIKNLFFSYIDYIKYSMDNLIDMDEGQYLPGTIEEIKSLLQTLNT